MVSYVPPQKHTHTPHFWTFLLLPEASGFLLLLLPPSREDEDEALWWLFGGSLLLFQLGRGLDTHVWAGEEKGKLTSLGPNLQLCLEGLRFLQVLAGHHHGLGIFRDQQIFGPLARNFSRATLTPHERH